MPFGAQMGAQGYREMQRFKLAEEAQKMAAQEQKVRMGHNLIQGFNSLLDAPPNVAGPMWDAFTKSLGADPKDPNIQILGKTFGKLDPEQRESFKGYLNEIGVQSPDQVVDFVSSLTRNPATMLQLFGKIGEHQQQKQVDKLLSGEAVGMTPQPEQQPQAQADPNQQIQAAATAQIGQLNGLLDSLMQRQQVILQAPLQPKAKTAALSQLNNVIGNTKERIAQLQKSVGGEANMNTVGGITAKIIQEMARKPDGSFDAEKGKALLHELQTNPQGADSRIYDYMVRTYGEAQGTSMYLGYVNQAAAARGAGAQQGALGVRQTPEYQENVTRTAESELKGQGLPAAMAKQVGEIDALIGRAKETETLFKPEYVGGAGGLAGGKKGSTGAITGAVRETTGRIGPDEVMFRQNTSDMQDALIRARSGAQTNEHEYDRVIAIAPKIGDQPEVYKAKLKNFMKQLENLKQKEIAAAKTPRGKVGQGGGQQQDPLGIR